jgi:hypothetical protein
VVDALMRGQRVTSTSYTSTSQTVINQTNNYPQAEPAAITRRRALDAATMYGALA